jgi:hypothetical protein
VTFDACKQSGYVNLSRVDPSLLVVKKPTPVYANPYICFRASAAPAKCLMFGFVHDDKTTQSFPVNGKVMKSFTIIPLSLEADRNFTVTCLLFNKNYYMTDFIRNELTFVTRMDDPGEHLCLFSAYVFNRCPFDRQYCLYSAFFIQEVVVIHYQSTTPGWCQQLNRRL